MGKDKKPLKLSTGREIELKEMSIDEIDYCQDMTIVVYDDYNNIDHIKNVSRSRTAWIRSGLAGGDFKKWSKNIKGEPVDSVLKELTEGEKNELMGLIQDHQRLGE